MNRPNEIIVEIDSMTTLVELTGAFQGIASMRIAQIRNQVLQSTKFFNELWGIYVQLRRGNPFSFGREQQSKVVDKELLIIITAEGGLSGDIDRKVVELMLQVYDKNKNDVIVIGHHGAQQLFQRGIAYKKYFRLPSKDQNVNIRPVVREILQYRSTKVFYQEYVSFMNQVVKQIEISSAVNEQAQDNTKDENVINEQTYIFEPSTRAVIAHLERSMMQIAINQLILESKLAQYASRFRAMSASRSRAGEIRDGLKLDYNRANRAAKDERLKEIINGLKSSKAGAGT